MHEIPIVENPPLARALACTRRNRSGNSGRALQGGRGSHRIRDALAQGVARGFGQKRDLGQVLPAGSGSAARLRALPGAGLIGVCAMSKETPVGPPIDR